MGQAKLRGSFEQRQKEGVDRKNQERREREQRLAAEEASLTDEQRAKRKKARVLLASMLGMAAASYHM